MEDSQQQEFFRSVSEAFERNREAAMQSFELILLGLVIILAAMQAVGYLRRRRGLVLGVEQIAFQRGLTRDELALVLDLARVGGVPPLRLLTHLDVFERVTGKALSGALSVFLSGEPLANQVRRIRHALHFDVLPAHAPLLTTRELSPGTAVHFGANHGQVSHLDEAHLEVELREPVSLERGTTVTLILTHAREARYELHCRLTEVRNGTQLLLAHDEAPVRVQQREYVRAKAAGPIRLVAVSWPGHSIEQREIEGQLVDLSGGGALVTCHTVLPPGVRFTATFSAGEQIFSKLDGVVIATHGRDAGTFELHLEFPRLPPAERERLIGAVAKLQATEQRAARA
ncbi:MAG: PilZ domain-containing protein [Myxococcaceae bacterium]|nr:PilZ domain-containing protein [Myxococcaceae bacterium]